jgi:hypothetical protein
MASTACRQKLSKGLSGFIGVALTFAVATAFDDRPDVSPTADRAT